MQGLRNTARMGFVVAALAVALIAPTGVFADDGEIGDLGDTDSITDLYVSGSRITGRIDYLKDCPGGLTGCEIQVKFRYKCPEAWCVNWSEQSWRTIPAPVSGVSTVQGDCNGGQDTENRWEMVYRVRWWATSTKTVTWKGEAEYGTQTSGSVGWRLIAEGAFNHTNGFGISGYTSIETVTATADYSPEVVASTSGGVVLTTC